MQHDSSLVRADIHVVRIGVELDVGEDERRLRDIVRLVHLVDGLGNLR